MNYCKCTIQLQAGHGVPRYSSNNDVLEKSLNGFINDYEVCVILCYMYIYSDTKIQETVENEQTIFVLSGL